MFRRQTKPRRSRPNLTLSKDGKKVDAKLSDFGIKSYMQKNGVGGYDMYFCRGEKCPRGPASKELSKHRCRSCIQGLEGETLTHLLDRIRTANEQ